jgi:transcriptional regulator with XRE-family HTH domain
LATTLGLKRQKILITFLIEHRKAAGMTQAQLADRLSKSRSFITRLQSGQRRIYVVELLELAEVLGFDAGKVVGALRRAEVRGALHRSLLTTRPTTRVLASLTRKENLLCICFGIDIDIKRTLKKVGEQFSAMRAYPAD